MAIQSMWRPILRRFSSKQDVMSVESSDRWDEAVAEGRKLASEERQLYEDEAELVSSGLKASGKDAAELLSPHVDMEWLDMWDDDLSPLFCDSEVCDDAFFRAIDAFRAGVALGQGSLMGLID